MAVPTHGWQGERWRCFERVRSTVESARYWDIRLVDASCEIRCGEFEGTARGVAQRERRDHASPTQARRTANRKIKTKLKVGWVEVVRSEAEPGDSELLRTLESGLTQVDGASTQDWAVYADYLMSVAPALGERVALSLQLEASSHEPQRRALAARIEQLEQRHGHGIFGAKLARMLHASDFGEHVELVRKHGMIVEASFGLSTTPPEADPLPLLEALLDSPAARLLTRLRINAGESHRALSHDAAALIAARPRPALRGLELMGVVTSGSALADTGLVAPQLEHLSLARGRPPGRILWQPGGGQVPAIELPRLRVAMLDAPWACGTRPLWSMAGLEQLESLLVRLVVGRQDGSRQTLTGLFETFEAHPLPAQVQISIAVWGLNMDESARRLERHRKALDACERISIRVYRTQLELRRLFRSLPNVEFEQRGRR